MKKYIFSLPAIFFLLGFWGCEKDYNEVVDPEDTIYAVSDSQLDFNIQDSSLTIRLAFSNDAEVKLVTCRIEDPNGNEIQGSPISLADDGNSQTNDIMNDNIYSGKILLSRNYPTGKYSIIFFVTDIADKAGLAASHSFDYDNGQPKFAPIINGITGPDTLTVINQNVSFVLEASVSDANGLSDIKRVFSYTVRPDSTSSGNQFDFNDNGSSGDRVAGDGIFSFGFSVTPDNNKGTYQFVLQAQDNSNLLSEKFIHNITLK